MKPEESFVRHQPCGDRIVFALILDRKKMKERIMAGEASQIFLGLNGNMDAELLCDVTRLLGTFLIDFENDMQGDWNSRQVISLRKNMQRLTRYGSMRQSVSGMNT